MKKPAGENTFRNSSGLTGTLTTLLSNILLEGVHDSLTE